MPWIDTRAPTSTVDISTQEFSEDAIGGYNEIRKLGPIVWQPQSRSFVLTTYADISAVLRDSRFFSPDPSVIWQELGDKLGRDYRDVGDFFSFMPFLLNGPPHMALRRAFAVAIAPFAGGSDAQLARMAGLLKTALQDGGCDLAADFAGYALFEVMCDLMEIPADERSELKSFANMSWGLDPILPVRDRDAVAATMRRARAFLTGHVASVLAREKPGFIRSIHAALPDAYTDKVAAAATIAAVILIMGNDAIGACISVSVHHLKTTASARQDEWAVLSDDAIRYVAPADFTARMATEDLTIAGCQIVKGDRLIVSPLCANHDPLEFGDTVEMITEKPSKNIGLAFGAGSHMCVGNRFSRTVVKDAFSLLARLPEFRLAGPPRHGRSRMVRNLQSLPIEFV
jgi:cytochrome P450